jgi:hypothetical protein
MLGWRSRIVQTEIPPLAGKGVSVRDDAISTGDGGEVSGGQMAAILLLWGEWGVGMGKVGCKGRMA